VNKLLVALFVLVLWPLSLRGDGVAQFDTVTGEGFVPKSDIQVAFDLTNGQVKRMSDSVTFAFAEKDTVVVNCKKGTLEAFVEFGSNVGSTLAYSKGQFVGFDLTGFVEAGWVKDPPPAETLCSGGTFGQITERQFTLSAVLGDETIVILGGGITP